LGFFAGEAVAGKTSAFMGFIDKDACVDSRIIVHDFLNFLDIRIEYSDARNIAAVCDRAYDR
jgi:hypothetical protein